jgi:hypothetical protein
MPKNGMVVKPQGARRRPWGTVFGFAVAGLYITFTIIAIARYPQRVSPLDTYLSMLGNAELSPHGAIFYNLAVILTGLAELPFFIAIYSAYSQHSLRWLLNIGLLAGLTNGVSVSMSGVYSQHINMNAHVTWSYIIFFSLIPVLLAFGLAFWRMKGVSRYIGLYSFIVCAIDIFFLATLLSGQTGAGPGSIMEWFSVFSYLAWIALISLDGLVRSRDESRA